MGKKRKIDPWGLSPDYETGYCRPPKASQIKPGEVRNPWGRTGKRQPAEDLLLKVAGELIAASVNGKTSRMSQEEAAYRKLLQEALKGNPTALKLTMEHLSRRRPPLPPMPTLEELQQQEAEQARREELSAQICDALDEMAEMKREAGLKAAGLDFYGRPLRAKGTEQSSSGSVDQPVEKPGG